LVDILGEGIPLPVECQGEQASRRQVSADYGCPVKFAPGI
jgi:hypothetical protein